MFLHLGGNMVVKTRDLVAIINVENGMPSRIPGTVEKTKVAATTKSLIITKENLYQSPISSGTLKKRAESSEFSTE